MQHEISLKKSIALQWVKQKRRTNLKDPSPKKIRFVDLFSGCGGLSHGLVVAAQMLGHKATCALAIDTNETALDVYKDNIPHDDGVVIEDDIINLFSSNITSQLTDKEEALKEKVGAIDIFLAGPPCQGHSDLNNSTRRNDPRNNLYLICARAVEVLQPNLVIVENVPAVIHSSEKVVQLTEERLKKLGYAVKCMTVNFLDLGIPQSRKRHVLVASKDTDYCDKLTTLSERRQTPTLKEFFDDIVPDSNIMYNSGKLSNDNLNRVEILFKEDLYNLPDQYRPSCHRDKKHSYSSVYGRLHYDKPAQTITSGFGSMGQGRYIHPSEKRTINPREAARIQGLPDYYDFSKVKKITELRKMIANVVPPQLSFSIGYSFLKSIL